MATPCHNLLLNGTRIANYAVEGGVELTPSTWVARMTISPKTLSTVDLEEHQRCRPGNAWRQRASAPGPRLKRRQFHHAVMIHPREQLYRSRREGIRGCDNRRRRLLCVSQCDN
jgi:hypothetical protein